MQDNQTYFDWQEVDYPKFHDELVPVVLSDATMAERKEKVLSQMREKQLDVLVIYCDLEHGSNFEYLTGFLTRFEESCLVLHQDGRAYLLLGNENTKMAKYARIEAECIHVPFFSLPNQPMQHDAPLTSYFEEAGILPNSMVGLVGWKLFTSNVEENDVLFDLPHFVVAAIQKVAGCLMNATGIMIDPACGTRITNNANEIAHYVFGASLASDAMLQAMDAIDIGKTEMEVASLLDLGGQPKSVVTICTTGGRFAMANLYPTNKKFQLGEKVSLTVGYKGGLSSRAGYVAETLEDLPLDQQDYLSVIAGPYFSAVATWLVHIYVGMAGKQLYEKIESMLPKSLYHWELNPGHLTGDEEWLSSPMYPESVAVLQSGMLLQIDIIPSCPGYAGVSVESTIALADARLRSEIRQEYPELWESMVQRRAFIRDELGIEIGEDVLPMSDTVAYWRPLLLSKRKAMVWKARR